jgi:hypothetical protein
MNNKFKAKLARSVKMVLALGSHLSDMHQMVQGDSKAKTKPSGRAKTKPSGVGQQRSRARSRGRGR